MYNEQKKKNICMPGEIFVPQNTKYKYKSTLNEKCKSSKKCVYVIVCNNYN